jgi:hypothetical protein
MFKQEFATLPDQKKIALLAFLAHDLTVCVRGAFLDQSGDDLIKSLRSFNELQHHISSRIGRLAEGPINDPHNTFAELLDEIATIGGVKFQFDWAAANATRIIG